LHHDSHILSAHAEYCPTCGQRLPAAEAGYGTWERKSRSKRIGIGVSIALHLLGVLYYLFAPAPKHTKAPPPKGGQMVYIAPLPEKKVPNKPAPKPEPTKAAKPPPPQHRAVAKNVPAAPVQKLETYVPPVQATMTPPPEQDMAEMIAKRRAAREAQNPPAPPAPPTETDAERANRIAKANIARANGGGQGGVDKDDTGGVFSVDKSYHSAEVKFRGWNTNFKRNWLQQIHVDQGSEPDIETAVVKEMIKVIRKEKQGDFQWESRRLGKVVTLSARKEDEKELTAFLLKEMFPEYTRGASR